jgi:hypothetical protein
MICEELQKNLKDAESAEIADSYFSAAILYKEALKRARKEQDSTSIKLCKRKIVEMNQKTIASGKDFKQIETLYEFSDEENQKLKNYIIRILQTKDKQSVLKGIGSDKSFTPVYARVKANTDNSLPLSHIIANLNTISSDGHNIKGGSDGTYSWFMTNYSIEQTQIVEVILGKLMYMLVYGNKYGEKLLFKDVKQYFSSSNHLSKERNQIVSQGIKCYLKKDYVSAIHILVPQFEGFLIDVVKSRGFNTVALDNTDLTATRTFTLSERDFDSEFFKNLLGEDFCMQCKFILFEQMGFRLRHKIAHGEVHLSECNFMNTTLILFLYLAVIAKLGENTTST